MSAKKDLFLALITQLKTVDDIKWIDKQFGQIDDLDNHVIPYPAVLIEFNNWETQTIGKNTQKGPLIIRFHTLYENFAASNDGSLDQNQAISYFDFVEKVHAALQGFSGSNFTALQRMQEEEDNEHSIIIDTILVYQTELTDESSAAKTVLTDTEITPIAVRKEPLDRPASNIISDFKM